MAASLTDGIGLATLLPIVTLATDGAGDSELNRAILDALAAIGIAPRLGPLLFVFATALCLKAALQIVAMRYVGYAAAEVSTQLRRQIIAAVLQARWRFLVKESMGRVANSLGVDATRAGKGYLQTAIFAAHSVQVAFYVVFAFVVSLQLAIAGFLIGLVVAAALHVLVRLARKAGWRQTSRTQQLVVSLSDTLNNIKPIKAMAREEPFSRLLEKRIGQLRNSLRVQVITTESLGNFQDMLVAILLSVTFYFAFGVWQVMLAELVVMGFVMLRIVSSIGKVQRAYQKAVTLESTFLNCTRLIEEAQAEAEPNPGRATPSFERELRLEHVTFRHGETTILDDVSMEVPRGELTVLIGPSGSGKTTIIDLMLGLHRVDAGRILIDGKPLDDIDLKQWRHLLAYVPQEQMLLHDTIEANVTLGDDGISRSEVEKALRLAGCWDFVAAMPDGLDSVVGEKGARLSGGQRQRIGLARALVLRPRLLILDEVTSALDEATAVAIAEQVRRLSRGVTVLAVTHRREFLDVADRVYQVEQGRVRHVTERPRQPVRAME